MWGFEVLIRLLFIAMVFPLDLIELFVVLTDCFSFSFMIASFFVWDKLL